MEQVLKENPPNKFLLESIETRLVIKISFESGGDQFLIVRQVHS